MTRLLTGLFSAEAFPAPRWAYLGRGLYLAWYMAVMLAEPPLLPAFSTQDALVAHRLVFFASYLAMCVVFAALWRRLSPLRTHRAVLAASTAVGLSGVVVYLLVMWGILPQGAMSIGFVCAAVALPILDIGWGEAYSYLPLRSIVAMLVVSVAICMALVAVTPAVHAWLGAALLLAQAAASRGLLIFALARSPYRSYREPGGEERARMLPSRSFLLGVALLVCAAYLINAASESVEGSGYLSLPGTVLSIAVAVAFLVATALHPDRDPARFLAYIGLFEAAAFLRPGPGRGTGRPRRHRERAHPLLRDVRRVHRMVRGDRCGADHQDEPLSRLLNRVGGHRVRKGGRGGGIGHGAAGPKHRGRGARAHMLRRYTSPPRAGDRRRSSFPSRTPSRRGRAPWQTRMG